MSRKADIIRDKGKMRESTRPIIVILLAFTLCIGAIVESAGWAELPAWFKGVAIPLVVEWVGERVVKRYKERNVQEKD